MNDDPIDNAEGEELPDADPSEPRPSGQELAYREWLASRLAEVKATEAERADQAAHRRRCRESGVPRKGGDGA